jgi:hypothetical protein
MSMIDEGCTPTEDARAHVLGHLYARLAALFLAKCDAGYTRRSLVQITEAHMKAGYPAADVSWMLGVVHGDLSGS